MNKNTIRWNKEVARFKLNSFIFVKSRTEEEEEEDEQEEDSIYCNEKIFANKSRRKTFTFSLLMG